MRERGAFVLAAVLAGMCLGLACRQKAEPVAEKPTFLNLDPAVGYVGRETCESCHFEQALTYAQTGMGRSFYPMTPEVALEDFEKNNVFVVEATGLHYRMEARDGKYFQKEYVVDSQGRELVAEEHELRWVVGSNNHSRSYAIVRGDEKLFQAPICWYPVVGRWDYCPGYETANDHFTRELSQQCLHCHNGRMELVEGQRNQFEQPYPHGIDCERCHGPGQLHVERWKSGQHTATGQADWTIIDPRRLPQAERIEVCFACHLGDAKSTERVARHGTRVDAARPGKLLTEFTVPFRYREKVEQEFGLSSQGDRLILSRCYEASGGKLECLTCHNPHVTVYHEQRPANHFRQRCLGCHELDTCTALDSRRQATSPADDCVACHMRKAESDDQRFAEFTDHWIRRNVHDGAPVHRTDHTIEPVFPDRLAALPAGEQAYYWGRANFLMAPLAAERARPGMWASAERSFLEAIQKGFDNADAWFFLGKVRLRLRRDGEAAQAFARAVERDPGHHDAAYALGQSLLDHGQAERAFEVFTDMLERNPDDTMALAEQGRAHMALGRPIEAIAAYHKAIAVEPWSAPLYVSLSKLMASQQRFVEAAEAIGKAAALDPDSPEVWLVYEKVMEAAGRPDQAAEARRHATRLKNLPPADHAPAMASMM